MKTILSIIILFVFSFSSHSQTNIFSTNPDVLEILKGNYNPQNYIPPIIINHPDSIVKLFVDQISPDSLHANLDILSSFYTRNSASDTVSNTIGIGAARRWAYQKFSDISSIRNSRLIPSYLQFDNTQICTVVQHRNIFAVLPGSDTTDKSIVLIEAHIDSRCKGLCDDTCLAQGMEDNGSGTALVLELARVMSQCVYNRTIVFLLTIAEEQGLYGASAFAKYIQQNNIAIHAVLNNDIVGGVYCGNTSSQPSCPGLGNIDSTHVRLFSDGGFNSPNKQFARFVKLEYDEEILPTSIVPTDLQIMSAEDRTGRGGDHIPFRQLFYTAIRITSANENGNANTSNPAYIDRQHTSADILGLNTDIDPELDSFFVDFNYLTRNAIINSNAAAMAAIGPLTPDLSVSAISDSTVAVAITNQTQYNQYRIGMRTSTNYFDSVFTFSNSLIDTIALDPSLFYAFSVASVDSNGIESLFSREVLQNIVGVNRINNISKGIKILPNTPNPSDDQTHIKIISDITLKNSSVYVSIHDALGKEVYHMPVEIHQGLNEVLYNHGFHVTGIFTCSLFVDGKKMDTVKMIFTN